MGGLSVSSGRGQGFWAYGHGSRVVGVVRWMAWVLGWEIGVFWWVARALELVGGLIVGQCRCLREVAMVPGWVVGVFEWRSWCQGRLFAVFGWGAMVLGRMSLIPRLAVTMHCWVSWLTRLI